MHHFLWKHMFLLALPNIENNMSSSLREMLCIISLQPASLDHPSGFSLPSTIVTYHYNSSFFSCKNILKKDASGCFHPSEGQRECLYAMCEPKTESVSHCFPSESAGGRYSRINMTSITAHYGCFLQAVTCPPSSD